MDTDFQWNLLPNEYHVRQVKLILFLFSELHIWKKKKKTKTHDLFSLSNFSLFLGLNFISNNMLSCFAFTNSKKEKKSTLISQSTGLSELE